MEGRVTAEEQELDCVPFLARRNGLSHLTYLLQAVLPEVFLCSFVFAVRSEEVVFV